jgi:enoyl-CoA hydratase/carnithine racemase
MELSRDGDVFVLRMSDGDNRMHDGFVAELVGHLDAVAAAAGPAALVTTGHDRFYSNGLDLDWLVGQDPADAHLFFRELFAVFARILTFPMITVAAVNGHAFGAGALLCLVHDRRVMRSDRGWWCMPEADHGWPLHPGMVAVLRARLRPAVAHAAIALATRYPAADALAAEIVDEVAPGDEVLERAVGWAAQHAAKADPALSALRGELYADALEILTTERGLTVRG